MIVALKGQASVPLPAQKKKKLEEQLAASKEYLDKMFGEGMPGTATQIADIQPQQSFMDIGSICCEACIHPSECP